MFGLPSEQDELRRELLKRDIFAGCVALLILIPLTALIILFVWNVALAPVTNNQGLNYLEACAWSTLMYIVLITAQNLVVRANKG